MNYTKFKDNTASTNRYNRNQQGVFALHPAATPKYALNLGLRDAEYKENLARMYLSLSGEDRETKNAYLRSLPSDANIQALAKVLIGDSTNGGTGFIDFFIAQIQESFNEKVQISEVLSDNYVAYFFGAAPPTLNIAGNLLNTYQDDQRIGMIQAYQTLIRGTECAKRGSLVRLRYDSVIVSGHIISLSQVLNAENELIASFNLTMVVKEYVIVTAPTLAVSKVETPFDPNNVLTSIGSASDVRVNTTIYVPNKSTDSSVAGKDATKIDTDDPNKTKAENVEARIAADAQTDPTKDVRGTIDTLISLPRPPIAIGL